MCRSNSNSEGEVIVKVFCSVGEHGMFPLSVAVLYSRCFEVGCASRLTRRLISFRGVLKY